jgi:hypothetical protein
MWESGIKVGPTDKAGNSSRASPAAARKAFRSVAFVSRMRKSLLEERIMYPYH